MRPASDGDEEEEEEEEDENCAETAERCALAAACEKAGSLLLFNPSSKLNGARGRQYNTRIRRRRP